MIAARLEKLRHSLAGKDLDAILISQAENRRYLSGFHGTAGYLLIGQEHAFLATDSRYTEQAKQQSPAFKVEQIEGPFPTWLPRLVAETKAKRLAFEGAEVSYNTHRALRNAIAGMPAADRPRLVACADLVEALRAVKDAQELEAITRAVALTDEAFEAVVSEMRPGVTEAAVAWQIERYMREHGGESVSFDLIVAAGANAALPHHHPADRPIAAGESVVIDIGVKVDGYCSDLTRTICLGPVSKELGNVYEIVLSAQLTAMATMKSGMTGKDADNLARLVIEKAGYGDRFGHGLGHGVGLEVHEQPRLGKSSEDVIADGMVITVEPGIYIPGWGGVRIEDMIVMENGTARGLTRAKKTEGPGRPI